MLGPEKLGEVSEFPETSVEVPQALARVPRVCGPCPVVADTSRSSISIDNVASKQSIGPHDIVGEKILFSNFSSF